MRIRWFGPGWGAPVCDAKYEAATPLGQVCMGCETLVEEGERGIIMAAYPGIDYAFRLHIDNGERWVVAAHIDCYLLTILPGGLGSVERRP